MAEVTTVSIVGASGYAGGELLRLLLCHPMVQVRQATSERHAGQPLWRLHPNLRKRTTLTFCRMEDLTMSDVLFLALPHGTAVKHFPRLQGLADVIIDLSGDFRLKDPADYVRWYDYTHPRPELLAEFVYGIPELHREEMRRARYISSAGCNATAVILGLFPLFREGLVDERGVVTEVKGGSSEGGNSASDASHHPVRSRCLRSYKPTGHRHCAEIRQELSADGEIPVHMSATTVELVRGVLATSHVFLRERLSEKEVWNVFRRAYRDEPFVRIVKEKEGLYRYPEPKLLAGTNFCDVGFEVDAHSNRVVVLSAIDNLMKGAAGQAVQALNIRSGWAETCGLDFPGLHPV